MTRIGLLLVAGAALAGPSFAQAPAAAPPCETAQHRAFDFWVGAWDVYPAGSDAPVAHSLIERLYRGCAIRENWMPLKGGGGGSLSAYVPEEKAGGRPGSIRAAPASNSRATPLRDAWC